MRTHTQPATAALSCSMRTRPTRHNPTGYDAIRHCHSHHNRHHIIERRSGNSKNFSGEGGISAPLWLNSFSISVTAMLLIASGSGV